MTQTNQTRPLGGRACFVACDLLGGASHDGFTSRDWRAQRLASRFALSPSVARLTAVLAFGEVAND